MKALSLKYSNPVLSQIQGCAIFLRYWVKLLLYGLLDCHNLSQFNFEYTHQVHTHTHPVNVPPAKEQEKKRERIVETHNQRSLKLVFIVTEKSTVPPPVHNKKNKLQLSLANWLFLFGSQ